MTDQNQGYHPQSAESFAPEFSSAQPYPQQEPYPQQQQPYPQYQSYPQHQAPGGDGVSSAMGIVGLVMGILSLTLCGGLTAPLGLIFSIIGLQQAKRSGTGRGLSIAGLVTSIVGMAVLMFTILYVVAYFGLIASVSV
ncbi:DUF4190 domain-containing protein [Brachybacterium sp. Marseille-Q7125]|uniref:DUF4190 domain-containing protein n=1 Tax=Brachybacterium sp. Marseille-Q7125 TaxID=2932815 RepID=UPI001FF6AA52|nr:DUF4190 domain-containing protein [Brachybacterium sp. Marseille-Q7125]